MEKKANKSILCVANWDSNVGYAWWLMESFWVVIDRQYGHEFEVVLAYPSISVIPKSITDSGIKVEEYDFKERGILQVLSNVRFLLKNNIKYIYFSDRNFFRWEYLIYRLAGIKRIIIHDHTPGMRTPPRGFKKFLKCIVARLPLVSADLIIGATEFVRNRNMEIACLPKRKCVSAPNGVPELGNRSNSVDIREEYSIPKESIIIVSVGRVDLYKGIDFSLDVVRYLVYKMKVVNLMYIYFGDGPDQSECEKIVKEKKIEKHVIFAGRKDNVIDYLPGCDIGLHTSRGEVGYSLSILEFMRASLPVVVPDNPSVCEATSHGETGLVYKDLDVASAAKALSDLIGNKEMRLGMKTASLKKINSKYSLEKCHKLLLTHLSKIII